MKWKMIMLLWLSMVIMKSRDNGISMVKQWKVILRMKISLSREKRRFQWRFLNLKYQKSFGACKQAVQFSSVQRQTNPQKVRGPTIITRAAASASDIQWPSPWIFSIHSQLVLNTYLPDLFDPVATIRGVYNLLFNSPALKIKSVNSSLFLFSLNLSTSQVNL